MIEFNRNKVINILVTSYKQLDDALVYAPNVAFNSYEKATTNELVEKIEDIMNNIKRLLEDLHD